MKLAYNQLEDKTPFWLPVGYTKDELKTFFATRVEGWEPEQDV